MSREYRNDGRDQISIEHLTGDVYIGDSRSRKRPDKETKWLRSFEKEILGRLATSLHNQILINLGKEIDLDQVRRLWDMEVKSGQITEAIAPDTDILSVFDRVDIQGKLLILGKPGAGKTTTLLELAKLLVKKALDDPIAPMPILLNLSSWKDPRQSIRDWTIAELSTKGIGSKISAEWLDDQKLLPLLDGLDEVRSDLQAACVSAINQFMTGEGKPDSIVVCSRREEYELYPQKLNLNGAIYLQELSDAQIEQYLRDVNKLALWHVLDLDVDLLELVRQPLLLSITLMTYREELADRWQALRSTQKRLEFLLDAYVERMLHREIHSQLYADDKAPTPQQTRQWLVRLARQLQRESETELLIEKMQPTWLMSSRQRWAYMLSFGLIVVLIGELSFGLIFGLIVVLIGEPLERVKEVVPWDEERRELGKQYPVLEQMRKEVGKHGIFGLIFGLTFGLIFGLAAGLIFGLIFGLAAGLIAMLSVVSKTEITTHTRPNQGIISSARNSLILLSGSVVVAFLIQGALSQLIRQFLSPSETARVLTAGFACLVWFSFFYGGGWACARHFSLRLVLFLSHAIPWNYARFLNYATDRMFLQRIGGRYRFIHKLLQEHMAKMGE